MLTQLGTIKARLNIDEFDLSSDAILTNAINAISARFDKETNRTFARTTAATQEFSADDTEICLASFPGLSRRQIRAETKQNRRLDRANQRRISDPSQLCYFPQLRILHSA